MGTALIFLAAKEADRPRIAAALLMAQILKTAAALADYHRDLRNYAQQEAIDRQVIATLERLPLPGYQPDLAAMSPVERDAWQARMATAGMNTTSGPAPAPLPNQLNVRDRTGARQSREGGRDGSGR
jgi:hypothetical protein